MIHYINKPKTGFLFFLDQVVLLFSMLFFYSSCFESIIEYKDNKAYEYDKAIVGDILKKDSNDFVHQLDTAGAKIAADFLKKYVEDRNKSLKESQVQSPSNIEKSQRVGREVEVPSLSEEEKEGLRKVLSRWF
ncbi:hypothetical protein ACRRVA_03565 [Candidatus Cardinium hertigii]|uniref:hypothetical protein n=1 Tax=Candidatus Cardinium hertigii TaxID=247481 RepID=UPI003D7C8FCB